MRKEEGRAEKRSVVVVVRGEVSRRPGTAVAAEEVQDVLEAELLRLAHVALAVERRLGERRLLLLEREDAVLDRAVDDELVDLDIVFLAVAVRAVERPATRERKGKKVRKGLVRDESGATTRRRRTAARWPGSTTGRGG